MAVHRLPHPSLSALFEHQPGRLVRSPMPKAIRPMISSSGEGAFDAAGWVFEVWHGGVRVLCFCEEEGVRLRFPLEKGRKGKFGEIAEALKEAMPLAGVVDGEIVREEGGAHLYVFDLLYVDRFDLRDWTLKERKEVLRAVLRPNEVVRLVGEVGQSGKKALEEACGRGERGIVAKRVGSAYVPGESGDWVEIACAGRARQRRTTVKNQKTKAGALAEYDRKRRFAETPEPPPEKAKPSAGKKPIFVVQEHHASRLHYDFRLEDRGVLVSWAVPKEPTEDPSVKRLAMRTEDHPLAYAKFHGDIPEGHYGAGHVEIWDRGTYTNLRSPKEKSLAKDLEKGHVKVNLRGKRLRGAYSLIRLSGQKKESWLLFKSREEKSGGV